MDDLLTNGGHHKTSNPDISSRIPVPRKGILKQRGLGSGMSSPDAEFDMGDALNSPGEGGEGGMGGAREHHNGDDVTTPRRSRHQLQHQKGHHQVQQGGKGDVHQSFMGIGFSPPARIVGRTASEPVSAKRGFRVRRKTSGEEWGGGNTPESEGNQFLANGSRSVPHRPSSLSRTSSYSRRPSQIPKLSVSWWETNSVAGEAPQHEDTPSDTDDTSSVRSFGSNTSSLISANWQGKCTKFVPHCQRRHLHDHHDPGEYLTPTQRKNRMIAELRKQLRNALKSLEEKEKHVSQLRDRLSELESVLDQGGFLAENNRLKAKLKLSQEQHKREMERLSIKFDARLRKLRRLMPSETDCTGADWGAEAALFVGAKDDVVPSAVDYDSGVTSDEPVDSKTLPTGETGAASPVQPVVRKAKMVAKSTITDPDVQIEELITENSALSLQVQSIQLDCMAYQNRVGELETSLVRLQELESGMTYHNQTVHPSSAASHCLNQDCIGRQSELVAQVEAYKQECIIWRTKASESDLRIHQMELERAELVETLENTRMELEESKVNYRVLESASESTDCTNQECIEAKEKVGDMEDMLAKLHELSSAGSHRGSLSVSSAGGSPRRSSTADRRPSTSDRSPSPCSVAYRSDIFQTLANTLQADKEQVAAERDATEMELKEIRLRLGVRTEELDTSNRELQALRDDIKMRITQLEVAELTMERMREQIITQTDKIKSMEVTVTRLEHAGVPVPVEDNSGVSVTQPLMKKKARFGMIQTTARNFQTELTMEELEESFVELKLLRANYKELSEKYELESADYTFRLQAAGQNLVVKSALADTLAGQLQSLQDAYEDAQARWNAERAIFTEKIQDLTPVATRVPFLEKELSEALEESTQDRHRCRTMKEEYETALEEALSGTLKVQATSEEYWKEKLSTTEKELADNKRKLERTQQDFSSCKILLNLEKAEIQNRLEGQCLELDVLQGKVFRERSHKTVQTEPDLMDKSVMCYPHTNEQGTSISDGDLYDEKLENIKLLKGELDTSRRQMEILSEKMTESNETTIVECQAKTKELMGLLEKYQEEMENLRVLRITEINDKAQLEGKVEQLQKERDTLERKEKDNLEKLETEFRLVQKDLQQVVDRYEAEKCDLKEQVLDGKDEIEKLQHRLVIARDDIRTELISPQHARAQAQIVMQPFVTSAIPTVPTSQPIKSEIECLLDLEKSAVEADAAGTLTASGSLLVLDGSESDASSGQHIRIIDHSVPHSHGMIDSGISVPSAAGSPAKIPLSSASRTIEPITDQHVIQGHRAKTIAFKLLHENQDLRLHLSELQEKINGALLETSQKRDSTNALSQKASTIVQSASDRIIPVSAKLEAHTSSSCSNLPESKVAIPVPTVTASEESYLAIAKLQELQGELNEVLSSYAEPIVNEAAIEALPSEEEEMTRKLMKWLACDLEHEKLELEAICQWYEKDKLKLNKILREVRLEYSDQRKSKEFLKTQLESISVELGTMKHAHQEVCHELELYKREDSRKVGQMIRAMEEDNMAVSQSDSNLAHSPKDEMATEKIKQKTGRMLQEVVSLEKQFRAAKYERAEAEENLKMLRGELEVVRADYETERDKLLAKIQELTGDEWSEESSINFVRELQRNLEIKKQELFDLSLRREKETRQLQEELYLERNKKGNLDYIRQLTRKIEVKDAEIRTLKIQLHELQVTSGVHLGKDVGLRSKILLMRQLEQDKVEIKELHGSLMELKTQYESHILSLKEKLRASVNILTEKENMIRIVEREHKSAESSLYCQKKQFEDDKALMLEAIKMLDTEKQELLETLSQVQSEKGNKSGEIERLWKRELNATKTRYEADLKMVRKDLQDENQRFENFRKIANAKLKTTTNILTEREDHIRILERELRSTEDTINSLKDKVKDQSDRHQLEIKDLNQKLVEKLKIPAADKKVRFMEEPGKTDPEELSQEKSSEEIEETSLQLSLQLAEEIESVSESMRMLATSLEDVRSQEMSSGESLTFQSVDSVLPSETSAAGDYTMPLEAYDDVIGFALAGGHVMPSTEGQPAPSVGEMEQLGIAPKVTSSQPSSSLLSATGKPSRNSIVDSIETSMLPSTSLDSTSKQSEDTECAEGSSSYASAQNEIADGPCSTSASANKGLHLAVPDRAASPSAASTSASIYSSASVTYSGPGSSDTELDASSLSSARENDMNKKEGFNALRVAKDRLESELDATQKELKMTTQELALTKEKLSIETRRLEAENSILKESVKISTEKFKKSKCELDTSETQTPSSAFSVSEVFSQVRGSDLSTLQDAACQRDLKMDEKASSAQSVSSVRDSDSQWDPSMFTSHFKTGHVQTTTPPVESIGVQSFDPPLELKFSENCCQTDDSHFTNVPTYSAASVGTSVDTFLTKPSSTQTDFDLTEEFYNFQSVVESFHEPLPSLNVSSAGPKSESSASGGTVSQSGDPTNGQPKSSSAFATSPISALAEADQDRQPMPGPGASNDEFGNLPPITLSQVSIGGHIEPTGPAQSTSDGGCGMMTSSTKTAVIAYPVDRPEMISTGVQVTHIERHFLNFISTETQTISAPNKGSIGEQPSGQKSSAVSEGSPLTDNQKFMTAKSSSSTVETQTFDPVVVAKKSETGTVALAPLASSESSVILKERTRSNSSPDVEISLPLKKSLNASGFESQSLENLLTSLDVELPANQIPIKSRHMECQTDLDISELTDRRQATDELDQAVMTNRILETRIEELDSEMELREHKHQEMYMVMFKKGQEVALAEAKAPSDSECFENCESIVGSFHAPQSEQTTSYSLCTSDFIGREVNLEWDAMSAAEGQDPSHSHDVQEFQAQVHKEMAKLRTGDPKVPGLSTEEILLRFLRDAFYYYLMNRDPKDHLNAILSILNFSDRQRLDVTKSKRS